LVHAFYTNIKLINGVMHSKVKDVKIILEGTILKDESGCKLDGVNVVLEVEDFDKFGVYKSCLRDPNIHNFSLFKTSSKG